jgi:D-alanyl-D-alanine carboxypeptidase/D-alanyl-D-alanine-endopeptidase (penicillin-binding protein 4)
VVDPLFGAPRFGEGWMWDDEPAAFMPPISAAAVDGGCVEVVIETTPSGLAARFVPTAGALELRVITDVGAQRKGSDDAPLLVTRGRYDGEHVVTVSGHLPAGATVTERLSVPDPALHTARILADLFAEQGVNMHIRVAAPSGPTPTAPHTVTLERTLAEVVRRTNKASDNLGAELLLRLLPSLGDTTVSLGPASVDAGLAALDHDVRALGLDPDTFRLADGSGVSHYSLLSAELLVRTLMDMHRRGGRAFDVFVDSLPVAGVDGTLARRMRGTAAEGRVRAKTGTISGVSNLAGYVTTESGRRLGFAILVQNFVGESKPWRALQDELCAALAAL